MRGRNPENRQKMTYLIKMGLSGNPELCRDRISTRQPRICPSWWGISTVIRQPGPKFPRCSRVEIQKVENSAQKVGMATHTTNTTRHPWKRCVGVATPLRGGCPRQAAPDGAYFTLQSHSWAELQPFENFKNGPKKGRFSALVTSKPRHGQGWDLRQKLSAPKWPPMMVLSGNAIKKFWVRDTLVDWQWPALLKHTVLNNFNLQPFP